MKNHFLAIFLTLSYLVVSNAFGMNRGIAPVPIRDDTVKQVGLYKESHALVIGVSQFADWPNLMRVDSNIRSTQKTLENHGFHVVVHSNTIFNNLNSSIESFINQYGQNPDHRLLLYFAGHGHTLKLAYGEEMGYITITGSPNPNKNEAGFLAKALDMQQIEVYAKLIQSKHALFLFDSCFSGSIFSINRSISKNIFSKISKPVRQFITAGSKYKEVPNQSIFCRQFILAPNGEDDSISDGYVMGVEFCGFLQRTVFNYSKGTQHPQYGNMRNPYLDKGDFFLSLKNLIHSNTTQALIAPIPSPPNTNVIPAPPKHPKKFGHLQVNMNIAHAKVKVNDQHKGIAHLNEPLNITGIPVGEAAIGIEAEGYIPLKFTSHIKNNDWTEEKEQFVHKDQIKDIGDLSNVNVRIFSSDSTVPPVAPAPVPSRVAIIREYIPLHKHRIIEKRS